MTEENHETLSDDIRSPDVIRTGYIQRPACRTQ